MMTPSIVLYRDRTVGNWMATFGDGITATLPYSTAERAGDIAAQVARANPGTRIGVKSCEFGPATWMEYGPVVWLKSGFGQ